MAHLGFPYTFAMVRLNPHFKQLKREYVFPIIENKLEELKRKFPQTEVLNFGIGDVALPIAPVIAHAISQAAQEMATEEGMKGYGPSCGYSFLRQAIAAHEFNDLGISAEEIFISDGANSDTVNILEILSRSNVIGIADPTYPAYLDTSILQGQKKIVFLPCLEENGFIPLPPQVHCDVIYLCSPNNPTGIAMNREQMKAWVGYAIKEKALLLIDNAYQAFISSAEVPQSIFEIPGAKECAIEFRSFSKSAGFTGLRCAYTILPRSVKGRLGRHEVPLYSFWERRQSTKFNGVAYPIQKGAEAVYTEEGRRATKAQVQLYLKVAKRLKEGLLALGLSCYGGVDAPYIWVKTPQKMGSWEFFDLLLEKCQLVCIPGKGFGKHGEGHVRFSAFTTPQKVTLALERLQKI